MKKIMLLLAGLALMVDAQADTIIAAKPQDKLSGVNKSIALYGNSYTHYNNNINTRLRDLSRSLLPNGAKDYMFRGITISRSPPSRWQIWLTKRARVWFIL